MKLFKDKTKDDKKKSKEDVLVPANSSEDGGVAEGMSGSDAFKGLEGSTAHKVLRNFYVSEKATMGAYDNQYIFEVFKNVNKSEVKKEVAKLFNVKVKSIKMLNMPEKRRDFGRHPGVKSGFKKAIVVLEKGYTIGQAKP